MTDSAANQHFQGKNPLEHLVSKKNEVAMELHGKEVSNTRRVFFNTFKETGILFLLLFIVLKEMRAFYLQIIVVFGVVGIGWLVWKVARHAMETWTHLERLHRLVEEERYEIEHHRDQEREELTELYRSKGFDGRLLEDVINVLMSDDDRLLQVMLEEEFGLTTEVIEHPLKQGFSAGLGVIVAAILLGLGLWIYPSWGICIAAALIVGIEGFIGAKLRKNDRLTAVIWNLSIAALLFGIVYFVINGINYLLISI